MKANLVRVPVSILLDYELTASAKLVWLVLQLDADMNASSLLSPTRLASRTGLSRPTVRRALTQLTALGWYTPPSPHHKATVRQPSGVQVVIPGELLANGSLHAQTRILYGVLQATPDYRNYRGQFRYSSLSAQTHQSPNTMRRCIRELAATDWLTIDQTNRTAPIVFSICNPVATKHEAMVNAARVRLHKAQYRGEALMREYLSLIVDSEQFQDNASPGFLVNPLTKELLQLDRFYPDKIAFEFNGPQHYGPTERYSAEDVAKQQVRDYIKIGICVTKRIPLVIIHAEDLNLQTMQQKIGHLLPLRDLGDQAPLINYLERKSMQYCKAAKRGWQSRASATR